MKEWFRKFSFLVSEGLGSHWAFFVALAVIIVWAISGPAFHFSDSWQLVINTGTTIVTFLMVFVIQTTQNRDGRAIQLKLDELIRAQKTARNVFAGLEDANEEELKNFREEFKKLREQGKDELVAAENASQRALRKRSSRNPQP